MEPHRAIWSLLEPHAALWILMSFMEPYQASCNLLELNEEDVIELTGTMDPSGASWSLMEPYKISLMEPTGA